MSEKLVVIGGTAAGLSAASKAKREGDFDVTVIERSGYTSYGACGLPYYVGGVIAEPEDLVTLTPDDLRTKRGMTVHLKCEAIGIDRAEKRVTVKNLITGERFFVSYDKLVIAAGASPVVPRIPGAELAGVMGLRTVEDGIALRALSRSGGICIVGGGFIGLELASELAEGGRTVSVVERLPHVLPTVCEEFALLVEDELRSCGVSLQTGTEVLRIEGENGHASSVVTSSGTIPCSTVIMSIGVRPNIALAQDAGLSIGVTGAIQVNESLQTSDPCIFSCGDCAETYNAITGKPMYMPLGTHANKQGKAAGLAIAGKPGKNPGAVGSQITKIRGLYIGGTGLSRKAALDAGFDPVSVTIKKGDRASYYPGGTECRICLTADRQSGQVIAGQSIGGETVAGRINVIAAAVTTGMTADQLASLDLVYAPPVAPVYDPIIVAAEQLTKKIGKG